MFTRRVIFQLKADSSAGLARTVRGDVLPPAARGVGLPTKDAGRGVKGES